MKVEIGVCPKCGGTTRVGKTVEVCLTCDWFGPRPEYRAFAAAWHDLAGALADAYVRSAVRAGRWLIARARRTERRAEGARDRPAE